MSKAKKAKQLGMNPATASNRLKKMLLFSFAQKLDMSVCHQCGEKIENIDNFSVEHKKAWLDTDDPKLLYFDLDNIAFSHLRCNVSARRTPKLVKGLSKYIGVSKAKAPRLVRERWKAAISVKGETKFLGHFDNEEEAARAYDKFVLDNKLDRPLNFH